MFKAQSKEINLKALLIFNKRFSESLTELQKERRVIKDSKCRADYYLVVPLFDRNKEFHETVLHKNRRIKPSGKWMERRYRSY